MLPNFPSPCNPRTRVSFQLAEAADVTVRVYGPDNPLVRTLEPGRRQASCYTVRNGAAYWGGHNELGEPTASGLYIVELTGGATRRRRRIMLLESSLPA